MSGIFLLLTPEQRDLFTQMQGLMSLLEGHASYVMNEVSRDHVHDVDRMRRALQARRRGSNIDRGIQKAIGFEQKIQQYEGGERFVREVVDRAGMDGFNRVWTSPANLPDAGRDPRARSLGRARHGVAAVRRPPAVARVLERVTATVREHDMLQPGDLRPRRGLGRSRFGVPALRAVAPAPLFKIALAVFHFDHRLREGSAADARTCAASRAVWGCRSMHAGPIPRRPAGESVEFWARVAP